MQVTPPPGFAHVSQESNSRYASPYQSFGSDTSSPAQVARPLAEQAPKAASQSPSLQSIWGSSSSLDASSFSRCASRALYPIPVGHNLKGQTSRGFGPWHRAGSGNAIFEINRSLTNGNKDHLGEKYRTAWRSCQQIS